MTWLYVVTAGAVAVRWGLWYLRDVIEWIEAPRRDYAPPSMLARLRLQDNRGACRMDPMPVLHLPGETVSGPRGA